MSLVGGGTAGDLGSMIGLLSDPKSLKSKFDQLSEAQRQAQEVLDKVGPAQDVLKLREEAKQALDEARAELLASKAKGAKIVADAQAKAQGMTEAADASVVSAQTRVQEASARAATIAAQSVAIEQNANKAIGALKSREDALAKGLAELISARDEHSKASAELADRRANIEQAIETLRATLAGI